MDKIIDFILEHTQDWSFGKTLIVLVIVIGILMFLKVGMFFKVH